MSTLALPTIVPLGNTAGLVPSEQELWEVSKRSRRHSQLYIVTSEMISESRQSHSRAGLPQTPTGGGTYKLVISPTIRKPSRWHKFAGVGDDRPSSETSYLQIWAVFLKPDPGDLNPSFINLHYVENSSSVGATLEGSEDAVRSPPKSPEVSSLARMIRAIHKRTLLDEDGMEDAQKAVEDACAFADREIPEEKPLVMVSDDGLVMLQWRNKEFGVLLTFTGDGTGNYSVKLPGGSYLARSMEFSLADRLPAEIKSAIERIAAT